MHSSFLDTLHDPAVRDLAWVIGSPGMLDDAFADYQGRVVDDAWCAAQLHQAAGWLAELDQVPLPLHQYISARPTRRLGHYFETLLAFWLLHTANTHLFATNLQVQDDQHTLGEYDFLFRNASGEICHWEVAIKFYLQAETRATQAAFIGPGTRDRLDLKLNHLFNLQLRLGQTPAGANALPAGLKLDKTQAFIKGYLFYHTSTLKRLAIAGVSATHLSGWWARHEIDTLPQATHESHWIIPPRMHWLAPACLPADAAVMTRAQLSQQLDEHFKQHQDARLICEISRNANGSWHEVGRGFVVCSAWPEMHPEAGARPAAKRNENRLD